MKITCSKLSTVAHLHTGGEGDRSGELRRERGKRETRKEEGNRKAGEKEKEKRGAGSERRTDQS